MQGSGKRADRGGVATSGLEMSQNSMRYAWPFEEVDRRLKDIMTTIFHNAYNASVECGVPGEVVIHPCVNTVIPDFFDFSIDVRHENPEVLNKVREILFSLEKREWQKCKCEVVLGWNRDTVYWDKKLVGYVREAVEELGISHMDINSGARS